MPTWIPLLVNLAIGVALVVIGALPGRAVERLPGRWRLLAVLPLVDAALLAGYVYAEDSYRGNGISRWEAYRSPGGALEPMFWLSVSLLGLCAFLLAYSGARGELRAFRVVALTGGLVAIVLVTATVIGFSTN